HGVDARVRLGEIARACRGGGDAVGNFAPVENGASARGPAHDVEVALGDAREIVAAPRRLMTSERDRGPAPRVDAQHPLAAAARARPSTKRARGFAKRPSETRCSGRISASATPTP